jgi:hypothetical protein
MNWKPLYVIFQDVTNRSNGVREAGRQSAPCKVERVIGITVARYYISFDQSYVPTNPVILFSTTLLVGLPCKVPSLTVPLAPGAT